MDDIRPEDSASQVGGQYLGTMSVVGGTTRKNLPPPRPPMQPPKLPAKFSQDPPQPETTASSSRPGSYGS